MLHWPQSATLVLVYRRFTNLVLPGRGLSLNSTKKYFSCNAFFASLAWSAGFLSVIFGILGKFRIDIGIQKNFRIFFSRWKKFSKITTSWQHLNLYRELKHSLYKFYIGNASIPYINWKVPQKCQDVGCFDNFFISKKSSGKFSDHLGRSEISSGIQKSHLENHPTSVKTRKTSKRDFCI